MEGNEDRGETVNEALPPQNETLAENFAADEPLAEGKRVITIDENDASNGSDKSAGKRTVGEGCRQMAANSSFGKSQKVQSGAKLGSAGISPILAKEGSRRIGPVISGSKKRKASLCIIPVAKNYGDSEHFPGNREDTVLPTVEVNVVKPGQSALVHGEASSSKSRNEKRRKGTWGRDPTCGMTVAEAWGSGNDLKKFSKRLNDTRCALQKWRKSSFGDCDKEIQLIEARLAWIQGERIGSIPRLPAPASDYLVWKKAKDGEFTVKRAYWECMKPIMDCTSKIWGAIWHSNIHCRLSTMIWRVAVGCLPTKDKLVFVQSKGCFLCEADVETHEHLFWDCPFAKALWFSGPFPTRFSSREDMGSKDVINEILLHTPTNIKKEFLSFMGVLFEEIWKVRNEVMIKAIPANIEEARSKVLRRFHEFSKVSDNRVDDNNWRNSMTYLVRKIPEETKYICVTDASWKDGVAGIAVGIFGKDSGQWSWNAKRTLARSPEDGELQAINWALRLGLDHRYNSIAILSDASLLVHALQKRKFPPYWELRPMMKSKTKQINIVF
ncbi:hypothetical protein F8388_015547 [Cannabis sativa]|uniref:Reverse transcriptase zinc-binding domain-containing protein n=1 Tax=Cannabis sativa TaxID=3483 RepID=A0A7J6GKR4_CANSA|nr:hypothetical protein F8388_015547 [Cannabis sativa]